MEDTWIAWSDSHGLPWSLLVSHRFRLMLFFGEIDPLASMELKPAVAVLISLSFVAGTLEPSNGIV